MNLKNIICVASRSDTGRVLSRNEDRIDEDLALGVVALADGMEGYYGAMWRARSLLTPYYGICEPSYPASPRARSIWRPGIQGRV